MSHATEHAGEGSVRMADAGSSVADAMCGVTGSGGCCVLARAPLEGMRIEEIGSRSEIFAQSHVMV